ncbi:MAG: phosphoribosylaminoimidazolesuccinocarboxamide synthase [Bacteroidales bacterium]|nr:phosphoribosylaminoimidazolesuccinocarboxamide synthase [Bacteroidales bacterium]
MEKRELIFDGNEKQVFATDDNHKVIFRYKDVTLAYGGVKRALFIGKGALDNKISALMLGELNRKGVETHFIEVINDNEQLCRKIQIIPLEFIVRNRIAGSLAERLGVKEGIRPEEPIVDLRYNNDELDDPLINDHHAIALGLATKEELKHMYSIATRTNTILKALCHKAGIELIDVKVEFGRDSLTGNIIISDELSPDTCRMWDEKTGEKLDKDRFRHDLSDVVASYREVLDRLTKAIA